MLSLTSSLQDKILSFTEIKEWPAQVQVCQRWREHVKALHLQYIRFHTDSRFIVIPRDLIFFTCKSLEGLKKEYCKYSGKPRYWCLLKGIPTEMEQEIQVFFTGHVFSCPCACYRDCGQWLFFRKPFGKRMYDFWNNERMKHFWEAEGWYRTNMRPRRFLCPKCRSSMIECGTD